MILHLTPGSGIVELHIHGEGRVALYQPETRPVSLADTPPLSSGSARRAAVVAGVAGLLVGIVSGAQINRPSDYVGLIPRPVPQASAADTLARPPIPSSLQYRTARFPVAAPTPIFPADPPDGVPAALTQQFGQAPVVVQPSNPTRPPAGSNAFGLEN